MAVSPKIVLSRSQDIPFNKLVLSQANVRRVKAGVSVEALAESIARHSLLQSLTVRPVLDADGQETGLFEVPVGGRRFRALEWLVAQKRMNKTAPVPCIIRTDGIAEEHSLVENIERETLHPLDQFRAFQTLRAKGRGEEEIAAAFGVTAAVVRQRLKLAAVSPRLLEIYAEGAMTLDQLMGFAISDDHARQEQVWDSVSRSWTPASPAQIKRLLTEGAVHAANKRAVFVGIDAYEAAGGAVLRDLFEQDGGGWLQDPALLDRLVADRLAQEAAALRAEGWKWVEAVETLPYGYRSGLRLIQGSTTLTEDEQGALAALQAEYDALSEEHDGLDDLPDEVDAKFAELEEALAAFETKPPRFTPEETAIGGVFLSVAPNGQLQVERGYVRPEDEPPAPAEETGTDAPVEASTAPVPLPTRAAAAASHAGPSVSAELADLPEEDEGIKPLPDRLLTELTAHRTLALRNALADDWDAAHLAVLHAMCLPLFYRAAGDTCLEITARSSGFAAQAPGLNDSAAARALDARHEAWAQQLPETAEHLWPALQALDHDSRHALFAHCAGLTVNAVMTPYDRRPRALAHADVLAGATGLDMAAAGWTPTVDTYLGRVTKARILDAVREARGEAAAAPLAALKKPDMAEAAAQLLAGTGWLPEVLRTPGITTPAPDDSAPAAAAMEMVAA